MIAVRGQLDGQQVVATLRDDGLLVGSPALVAAIDELITSEARVGWANMSSAASLDLERDWLRRATLLAPLTTAPAVSPATRRRSTRCRPAPRHSP